MFNGEHLSVPKQLAFAYSKRCDRNCLVQLFCVFQLQQLQQQKQFQPAAAAESLTVVWGSSQANTGLSV